APLWQGVVADGPKPVAATGETLALAAAGAALERANAQRAAQEARLRAQSRELEKRADWGFSLAREIEKRDATVRSLQSELEAAHEVMRRLDQVETELDRVRPFESELTRVHASTSWRITQPLRDAARIVRRVRSSLAFRIRRTLSLFGRARRSLKMRGISGTLKRAFLGGMKPPPVQPPDIPATDPFAPFAVPTSDAPRVSIVVPVYNHFEHTLTCLRSLAQHAGTVPFETIVVDDCSSDQTPQRLAEIAGIRALRNERNLGFIGACNAGAALARGEYVLFLNNDTAVTAGWLEALLDAFVAEPQAGLVGAKLVYPDGRLQEAGGIVFADASGWNYGRFDDPSMPQYEYLREVDYCSGAAIVLPRALWHRLGGFDTRYAPAYYEDTDLAFRVREAGLKVVYQPAATVVHFEGVTSGTDTASGVKRYQVVNQQKFAERWAKVLPRQPRPGVPIARARAHGAPKRVLIVDACTPMPDQDSGSVRMTNLMRVLRGLGWQVTFVVENLAYHGHYTHALQRLGVEAVFHPQVSDIVAWMAENGPTLDAVILSRHYVAASFLPLVRQYAPHARIVFDTVDLHYLREQRAAELHGGNELARQARATRVQELKIVRAADVTLVVSPVEQELLRLECPGSRVEILSNVHEVVGSRRPFAERRDIQFTGGFGHPPNVDAVQWFVDEIWPQVAQRLPDARFHVIGSRLPEELGRLAGERIVVHGHVESLDPFLDGCRLSVAPLRYGAGVKGKVNMAMAHGLPVVATPIAVEGMHVEPGEDVLVAEDAKAFADAVVAAYEDQALWQKLSTRGVANVAKHFSFEAARSAVAAVLPRR
ncbi:MAG TPA: glycosyltransferase, partial [Xanthomonadales bacterium]|nr:glycosyltransferase [Xanthomonadales bacterium]